MKSISIPPLLYILIFSQFHVGNIINTIGLSMYIVARFDATDWQVGLLGAVQFLSYGVVAWAGGILSDRLHKRFLIVLGLILLSGGFWSIPLVSSLAWIYFLAAYCSVVQIIVFPANFGLLAETAQGPRLSRLLGACAFCIVSAGAVAAFLVGRLIDHFGPRATFHAAAVICWITAGLLTVFRPRRDGEERNKMGGLTTKSSASVIAPPNAWAYVGAGLALNFTSFWVGLTHQTFLVRVAKMPDFALSLSRQSNIQGLRMLCALGGYVAGVAWVGWHWRRWPFWVMGSILVVVTFGSALSSSPALLTLFIAAGGFVTAFCNQMGLYYAVGSGVAGRGRGAGLTETALALGGGLGPLAGGIAARAAGSPQVAYATALLPLAVCAVILGILLKKPAMEEP